MIVGLIAVSTVLFVVGVALERGSEAAEDAAAHQEVSGEPASGSHEEAGQAAEGGEEAGAHHEEAGSHQEDGGTAEHRGESFFGINPDATWAVASVVIGWVVLAAALLLFGSRVLILIVIALAAAAATVLDVVEVARQLERAAATVASRSRNTAPILNSPAAE